MKKSTKESFVALRNNKSREYTMKELDKIAGTSIISGTKRD